jgi:hypothetical protein
MRRCDLKVYKYLSPEKPTRIEQILTSKRFYFCKWSELNDPMEGYFKYQPHAHLPREIQEIVEDKRRQGICCFSLSCSEILLWTHYAGNHKGICIEVEVDFRDSDSVCLEVIKYASSIPSIWKETDQKRLVRDILSTKIDIWKYEQEVRAFCEGSDTFHIVGKITGIFLGLRTDDSIRDLVSRSRGDAHISCASLNTSSNSIDFSACT